MTDQNNQPAVEGEVVTPVPAAQPAAPRPAAELNEAEVAELFPDDAAEPQEPAPTPGAGAVATLRKQRTWGALERKLAANPELYQQVLALAAEYNDPDA